MYNHVLVAVSIDEDRDAQAALQAAQTLSGGSGKITILHVVEHLPQYAQNLLPDDHLQTAKSRISELLAPLVDTAKNAELVIVEGHSGRTIVDYAGNHRVDCIVVASHRPGLQDVFLGSTAARVVRHAECSVHVVR